MADVSAIFGILLFLGITFPGMLIAERAIFPHVVSRAQAKLTIRPWSSFWLGLGLALIILIPIVVLFALPIGPAKLMGAVLLVFSLGFASLGAAGLAGRMGVELIKDQENKNTSFTAFMRGAITLTLAAAFPFIGWFLIIPLTTIISLGAATLALFGRATTPATSSVTAQGSPRASGEPLVDVGGIPHDVVAS